MGLADPHCNLHGPNEFFHVADLVAGTKAAARFLAEIAAAG
jgi:acetylornithine deacetylase/succinyl-diaminopimelate desuccinylase-like protein